ncbi:M48 family metalloprotease [Endozoicomonadaceae bacterium StTr2]
MITQLVKSVARGIACSVIIGAGFVITPSSAGELQLPSLGDSTSAIVSQQQEHELGRAWLQVLRSRVSTLPDPEIKSYTESLIYRLLAASEVRDPRLEIIMMDTPQFNAFAVPGGIIGVNGGLFLYANTEQQFASVLAHELAHLSQRHYARNVEEAKRSSLPTAAALIGSIILAATTGSDVGIAALSSTIAGAQARQLSFSRQFEKEADRVGIQTMINAGMDPRAMPEMFEQLMQSARFSGGSMPEFLRTHPVTENRVADSRARAEQYPAKPYKDSLTYHLMRARMQVHYAASTENSVRRFEAELESGRTANKDVTRYGLAYAQLRNAQPLQAEKTLAPLLKQDPENSHFIYLQSQILLARQQPEQAKALIQKSLKIYPGDLSLSISLANTYELQKEYQKAVVELEALTRKRPNDPDIWYDLAEVQGKARNTLGVHMARAEYFFLTGNMDDALQHLEYAKKLAGSNYALVSRIDSRMEEVRAYKEKMKF